jgi:hypothetical protein
MVLRRPDDDESLFCVTHFHTGPTQVTEFIGPSEVKLLSLSVCLSCKHSQSIDRFRVSTPFHKTDQRSFIQFHSFDHGVRAATSPLTQSAPQPPKLSKIQSQIFALPGFQTAGRGHLYIASRSVSVDKVVPLVVASVVGAEDDKFYANANAGLATAAIISTCFSTDTSTSNNNDQEILTKRKRIHAPLIRRTLFF